MPPPTQSVRPTLSIPVPAATAASARATRLRDTQGQQHLDESYLTTATPSDGDVSVDVPPIYDFNPSRIRFVDQLDARESPTNLLACVADTPDPSAVARPNWPRKFLLADARGALTVNVWGQRGDAYAAYLRVGDVVYLSGIIKLLFPLFTCLTLNSEQRYFAQSLQEQARGIDNSSHQVTALLPYQPHRRARRRLPARPRPLDGRSQISDRFGPLEAPSTRFVLIYYCILLSSDPLSYSDRTTVHSIQSVPR
jgi:hypothetical protein